MKVIRNLLAALGLSAGAFAAGQAIDIPSSVAPSCPPQWITEQGSDPGMPDSPNAGRDFVTCTLPVDFADENGLTPAGTIIVVWDDGSVYGEYPDGSPMPDPRSVLR